LLTGRPPSPSPAFAGSSRLWERQLSPTWLR